MISRTIIQDNGDFVLIENSQFGSATANVRGDFGGGTLIFGYRDDEDNFQRYKTNAIYSEPDSVFIPGMGFDTTLMVRMSDGISPDMIIELNKVIEGR